MDFYVPVKWKYLFSVIFALSWGFLSVLLINPFIVELAEYVPLLLAQIILYSIAIFPGMMNAFVVSALILDTRPKKRKVGYYLPVTLVISVDEKSSNLSSTFVSLMKQRYEGAINVIISSFGPNKNPILDEVERNFTNIKVVHNPEASTKTQALNQLLKNHIETELIITIDSDSVLTKNAISNMIDRYQSDPTNTAIITGALLVKNSRTNIITKSQEWDYFHGYSSEKRLQSMFQGAIPVDTRFALFDVGILKHLDCRLDTDDMILTWHLLDENYRVGYAEDACIFVDAHENWSDIVEEKSLLNKGTLEAFKQHWKLLFKAKIVTVIVWWNLVFPMFDLIFTLTFLPGLILSLFGFTFLLYPLLLTVFPMFLITNLISYQCQSKMFKKQGLSIRHNTSGFLVYMFFYHIIIRPASSIGYLKQIVKTFI